MSEEKSVPDKILELEFNYAKETAHQAMDDRHKLVNFYLILTGAILAGVLNLMTGFDQENGMLTKFQADAFAVGLLFLLSIVGFLYLLKLIQLRVRWYDSALCMNRIKEYVKKYENISDDEYNAAFRWNKDTLKNKIKLGGFLTISFYSSFLVILLGSLSLAFAFCLLAVPMWIVGGVLLISIVFQSSYYQLYINRKKTSYENSDQKQDA